jgi:hypothetical protein
MADTPDTAQRLAEIRLKVRQWRQGWPSIGDPPPSNSTLFLLDHIDTLTAKLAEVEAERDRLRGTLALSDDFPRMATTIVNATIRAEKAEAERDALRSKLADAYVEPYWTERYQASFTPPPSPVEGGQ